MTDNIQKESEDYANSKGYRSDKEQYTTTPWTEWNIRQAAYIRGRKKTLEEAESYKQKWHLEADDHMNTKVKLRSLIEKAFHHALDNRFSRHIDKVWQQFKKDNGL